MVQICLVLRTPLALLVQETGGFQGYLWLLTFSDSRLQYEEAQCGFCPSYTQGSSFCEEEVLALDLPPPTSLISQEEVSK